MTTDDPIIGRLLEHAGAAAGDLRVPADAGPDTPLVDGGFWLDSVALLELITACEHEFGVSLDPAIDVTPATLGSVQSLADAIRRKLR
jgi:acyl carrier protein